MTSISSPITVLAYCLVPSQLIQKIMNGTNLPISKELRKGYLSSYRSRKVYPI